MSTASLPTKIKQTFGYKQYLAPDAVNLKFRFELMKNESERLRNGKWMHTFIMTDGIFSRINEGSE